MKKLLLFSLILVFTFPKEMKAQRRKSKGEKTAQTPPPPKKSKIPKYADFVTSKTKTDDGVFKVHEKDNNYIY